MRKCLICLLLTLCLLGSALAEVSLPPAGIGTHKYNFAAVYDAQSGAYYFALPSWTNAAFWRYHPQEGWRKIAQIWNDVWDVQYSDGWLFYKKSGGWSGGYTDLHALNVNTGKKVYLVKNRCSLLAAADGEAIIYNESSEMYERVNPETLECTPIEWAGSHYRSQTGGTFRDDNDAWSFRPYGGEETPLGYVSERDVYALSPDCFVSFDYDYSRAPYGDLEIWRGGECILTTRCDDWLMDERYVVWYKIEQERWTTVNGKATVYHTAEEHIKHLYIYDTLGEHEAPHCVEVPVDMRIDRGMSLVNGTAVILTATKWGRSTIACIDLTTGEVTTLQN